MEKARFVDAQINDLAWNDDLGLCRIIHIDLDMDYPIRVEGVSTSYFSGESEEFTLDGKRFLESPKATLYYYSEEDHYLTERPKPKIVISGLSTGHCPCGQYLGKAFSLLGTLVNKHDGTRQFVDIPCPNENCDRTYTIWVKK